MIPTEEFRELQREWYARGASDEAPLPVSELRDDYYRLKLESGLINRSSEYSAQWVVEDDEYSITPQMTGGEYTVPYLEFLDHGLDLSDDEDLTDTGSESVYDEDLTFDLAGEVEEFVRDVTEIAGLTPRERQVVEWIASGNSVVGDYVDRLSQSLGVPPTSTVRVHVKNALSKLREHWAGDMDATGLVDPRYLEPLRADEFTCPECHLYRHTHQRQESGVCAECDPSGL